jgi:hypothetical protein
MTENTNELRVCRVCGDKKPADQFRSLVTNSHKNRKGVTHHYTYQEKRCNDCRRKQNSAYMKGYKKRGAESSFPGFGEYGFIFKADVKYWH